MQLYNAARKQAHERWLQALLTFSSIIRGHFRGGGEGRGPGLGQGGGGGPRLGGRKESLWPGNRPIPLLLLSPTMRSPQKCDVAHCEL